MSLLDMAKDSLEACGVNVRGWNKDRIAAAALRGEYFDGGAQTSTDFPGILANVANKSLRQAYQAWPQTFKAFSRQVTAPDFKDINRPQLNDVPALQQLNEKGEYHRANLTDQNQNYKLATYGEIVSITRKTIINDDLRAFTRVPQQLGVAAAQMESNTAWGVVTGNQVMQADGLTLFHASHNNLETGSGSALGETPLATARAQMRLQKGPKGTTLNLVPRFLAVPAALETTASQLIVPIGLAATAVTGVIPEWIRSLVPIVEAASPTRATAQRRGICLPIRHRSTRLSTATSKGKTAPTSRRSPASTLTVSKSRLASTSRRAPLTIAACRRTRACNRKRAEHAWRLPGENLLHSTPGEPLKTFQDSEVPNMQGRVKVWDEERYFGFVINEGGDWFFHGSMVTGPIAKNDVVDFWLDDNARGGLNAVDVQRHIESEAA